MRTPQLIFSALLASLFVGLRPAAAQILSFTLTPTGAVVMPNETLTLEATLTNRDTAEVFLNGDRFQFGGPGVSLDDSLFFSGAPLSLQSGGSWRGPIFQVSVALGASPGDYVGSFTIVGGADNFSQDDLAVQNFVITVPQIVVAGEPDAFPLIVLGMLTMGCLSRLYKCRLEGR